MLERQNVSPGCTFFTESFRARVRGRHLTWPTGAFSDTVLVLVLELASQTCKPDEAAATTAALAHAIAPAPSLPPYPRLEFVAMGMERDPSLRDGAPQKQIFRADKVCHPWPLKPGSGNSLPRSGYGNAQLTNPPLIWCEEGPIC